MKVGEIMSKDIISANKNEDLYHILNLMEKNNISKLPIVEHNKIIGIVTDNKIADKLGSIKTKGVPAARMHASTVMEKKFERVSPDMDINDILKSVGEPGPTMLPVVMDEELVGVITKADLLPLVNSTDSIVEIMSKNVLTVRPDERIIHVRRLMLDNNIARIPVTQNGSVVGIISDTEIAFALAEIRKNISVGKQQNRLKSLMVSDIMETHVITASNNITIKETANVMSKNEIGCLPIVNNNNKMVGIITRTDILKHLMNELK